jgi:NADP-dependent 3-hydroxy acid dehydrogenase YdfG
MSSPLAVITGASSGIGEATARRFARNGWRVVLVARTRTKLQEVADAIGAAGGRAVVEAADAADGPQVIAMAERVRRQHGAPLLIVNSAGAGRWLFIEETSPEEVQKMMEAPFLAAFNVCHAFMADMLESRSGTIIHVGSPAARIPWPGATGYTSSRWALRGLHESLCQDLRGTGVESCHVVFGEVSSPYFDNNPGVRDSMPTLGKLIPVLSPERCAEIIARTARRPRRQVVAPAMLRLMYWFAAVAPAPTRWLIARTGRRH